MRVLKGHLDYVVDLEFHPLRSNELCSVSFDGKLKIWNIQEEEPVETIKLTTGKYARPLSTDYSETGDLIAVGDSLGTICILTRAGELLRRIKIPGSYIKQVKFLEPGIIGFIGVFKKSTRFFLYDLDAEEFFSPIEFEYVDFDFRRPVKRLIALSKQEQIDVINMDDWEVESRIEDVESPVALSISFKGKYGAVGEESGRIKIFDLQNGKLKRNFDTADRINSLAYAPKGSLIAMDSGFDVQLWDIKRPSIISKLEGHTAPIRDLKFSPSGKQVASAGEDNSVRVWSLIDQQEPELVEFVAVEHEERECSLCKTLIKKNQRQVFCPACGSLFHFDHYSSFVKQAGYCPTCKQRITVRKKE
ncbi:MAG: hypothetical protein ACXAEU_07420 [Candidatus Hodarchaeales archaeon]|jgi:WD40 repeat protein